MTPAAGRGGNPPSREHPISAGSAGGRHPGGRLRPGQVTPPRPGQLPPPAPAAPSPGHGRRLPRAMPAREGGGLPCPPLPGAGELHVLGGSGRQSPELQHDRGCGLGGDGGGWEPRVAPARTPPPPGATRRGAVGTGQPLGQVSARSFCPHRARPQVPAVGISPLSVSLSKCGQVARRAGGFGLSEANFSVLESLTIQGRCGVLNSLP